MLTLNPHGIPRAEWVDRFKTAFITQAGLDASCADDIVQAELESWPEQDENPVPGYDAGLMTELPETAVAENLSYWSE